MQQKPCSGALLPTPAAVFHFARRAPTYLLPFYLPPRAPQRAAAACPTYRRLRARAAAWYSAMSAAAVCRLRAHSVFIAACAACRFLSRAMSSSAIFRAPLPMPMYCLYHIPRAVPSTTYSPFLYRAAACYSCYIAAVRYQPRLPATCKPRSPSFPAHVLLLLRRSCSAAVPWRRLLRSGRGDSASACRRAAGEGRFFFFCCCCPFLPACRACCTPAGLLLYAHARLLRALCPLPL